MSAVQSKMWWLSGMHASELPYAFMWTEYPGSNCKYNKGEAQLGKFMSGGCGLLVGWWVGSPWGRQAGGQASRWLGWVGSG